MLTRGGERRRGGASFSLQHRLQPMSEKRQDAG
jgi:hypothetical protein